MPLNVLVVDDDTDVRDMLTMMLGTTGMTVVGQAENGEEAISKVEELAPDVVVMDLMMPVMDGVDSTKNIHARWPHIAVIGFTAAEDEAVTRMLAAGAVSVVEKTRLSELMHVMGRHKLTP